MKEFKFRVWDGQMMEIFDLEMAMLGQYNSEYVEPWPSEPNEQQVKKHLKFMQYTGLKDKNGKEIYEGDIVSYGNWELLPVKWDEDRAKFVVSYYLYDFDTYEEDVEVIGNIYENPELIKDF